MVGKHAGAKDAVCLRQGKSCRLAPLEIYVLVVLLILVVVTVFPVAISTPVGGVSIHHARLGHYYRRFRHNDGCALHDHRLRYHHRSRLYNHRCGGDRDRHTHPN
jgi:hypothetical protein